MSETETTRQTSGSVSGGSKPRRRWLRRLLLVGGLLLVLVVLLVLLVPTLLSTGMGKGFVLGAVNDSIAGEVEADGLSVGWLSGQSVTGVVVRDADGNEVARVGRVDLPDASLWGLVQGGLALGELRIETVTADIVGYEDGTTNLQRALAGRGGAPTSSGKPSSGKKTTPGGGTASSAAWPEGLSLGVVVRDVDISYRADGVADLIRLTVPQADLTATDPAHLVLKLNAELSQADRKGSVTADAQVDKLFDASGVYQPGQAVARVDAKVSDLPVDLLDALMKQDGRLTALLGPVLNGGVYSDVTAKGGSVDVTAVTEHLDIEGEFAFDDAGVTGVGTSYIKLTLTPQAWAVLSAKGDKPASTLAEPVAVAIELAGFGLPINDNGIDLASANVDLGLTVGDARLLIDQVGEVTLGSTTGGIHSAQLGKRLAATFNTTSSINRKPGGVKLKIELTDLIDDEQRINTTGLSAKINGALTNAPVAAVLDELMPGVTHGLATRTLGPTVDADINVVAGPKADGDGMAGSFNVDLLTTGGEAGLLSALIGQFSTGGLEAHFDLADGSYAKFDLTPGLIEAYREVMAADSGSEETPGTSAVALGGPASFRLEFTEARAELIDTGTSYEIMPESLRIQGKLTSPRVKLNREDALAATLRDMLLALDIDVDTGVTGLELMAGIEYPTTDAGEEPKMGQVRSVTTLKGVLTAETDLDPDDVSIQTDTHIRQAPIDLIDAYFDMGGELVASIGPKARIDVVGTYSLGDLIDGQGSGGIDLAMVSRVASADMKLLVEDGQWKLKADAPMKFQVTPRLSQVVLKKVNPFLGGAVSAKLPIGVTLKQEGFSVPVSEAEIADVNADINLELGELDLRGEGLLKNVLEQLGVGERSLLNVGFSPVLINLADGKLSYKDLTMSLDDVVLGFSGEVDLSNERLDLKMTIPGSSLNHIKWLRGAVDPGHVIVVPLTGTFDKPVIDIKLLSGEIAKAALRGQLKGAAGDAIGDKIGGEAGAVVGGLLDEFLGGPKEQGTAEDTDVPGATQEEADLQPAQPQGKPAVDRPLTDEERQARRERRQKRRERLEREAAEREAQQAEP